MNGEDLDSDDMLAAETALGLLAGEALAEARMRVRTDAGFASAVAAWEARLAPLFDEIEAVEPDALVWEKIRAGLGASAAMPAADNVVQLRRRPAGWRTYAAAATAIAASLALVLGLERMQGPDVVTRPVPVPVPGPTPVPTPVPAPTTSPTPTPSPPIEPSGTLIPDPAPPPPLPAPPPPQPAPAPAPTLVATLSGTGPTRLVAAWQPGTNSLLVTPVEMKPSARHDHQLWLIPQGGKPVSLGLLRGGAPQRVSVPLSLAPYVGAAATLAVSVEPTGGSPTGQPTGPVVASGKLSRV